MRITITEHPTGSGRYYLQKRGWAAPEDLARKAMALHRPDVDPSRWLIQKQDRETTIAVQVATGEMFDHQIAPAKFCHRGRFYTCRVVDGLLEIGSGWMGDGSFPTDRVKLINLKNAKAEANQKLRGLVTSALLSLKLNPFHGMAEF